MHFRRPREGVPEYRPSRVAWLYDALHASRFGRSGRLVVKRLSCPRNRARYKYDLDQQANGTCPFGFFCLEVCGSLVESVVVPVGQSRLVERGNLPGITVTQYMLRCVRSP